MDQSSTCVPRRRQVTQSPSSGPRIETTGILSRSSSILDQLIGQNHRESITPNDVLARQDRPPRCWPIVTSAAATHKSMPTLIRQGCASSTPRRNSREKCPWRMARSIMVGLSFVMVSSLREDTLRQITLLSQMINYLSASTHCFLSPSRTYFTAWKLFLFRRFLTPRHDRALSASAPSLIFNLRRVAEDEESLAAAISKQGVRAFIADILPYTGELYRCPAQGGVIARFGVGHDSVDKEQASANGIWVANTPGVLDNAVAEHAVWMIGALARQVHHAHTTTAAGDWKPATGIEVSGRKIYDPWMRSHRPHSQRQASPRHGHACHRL